MQLQLKGNLPQQEMGEVVRSIRAPLPIAKAAVAQALQQGNMGNAIQNLMNDGNSIRIILCVAIYGHGSAADVSGCFRG